MGDTARAVHGLDLETLFEGLQPIPKPLPAGEAVLAEQLTSMQRVVRTGRRRTATA